MIPLPTKTRFLKTVDIREGKTFSVPLSWSDNAAYICGSKYARVIGGKWEQSAWDVIDRITDTIFPNDLRSRKLSQAMLDQQVAFNSPVWFNVGVHPNPQCPACFILSLGDSMESITEWWKTQTFIFKYGSGMGADLSQLREKGSRVGEDGTSSGPLSFARVADTIGAATRSGGITRRAATMLTMKDWHPDVLDFIDTKAKAERIIRSLANAGVDVGLNSDIYEIISHQQANRAVRLQDDFFAAVEADELWPLISPQDHRVRGVVPAREMLNRIATACWECGDPGVQYEDTIQAWHTIPGAGAINSSNPCSEYMSIDDSSCNLASINLLKFWDREQKLFNIAELVQLVNLMIDAMDRLVDLSSYPTEAIGSNTRKFRQLGLGFTNLGGLLMVMGLPYDSEEGRMVAAALMAIITGAGYVRSADLAMDEGSYMELDSMNCEATWHVLSKHAQAMKKLHAELQQVGTTNRAPYLQLAHWVDQFRDGLELRVDEKLPVRNSQISVIAPTGTISFVMDASTTGIEPAFSVVYEKELVSDHTRLTVPLMTVDGGLEALGYDSQERYRMARKISHQGSVKGVVKPDEEAIFATAVDPLGNDISPEAHVRMVAAVQPFVSGAISKTINLPHTATVQDFERNIRLGWRLGTKALTFYRDGSKGTQPISVKVEAPLCGGCQTPMIQTGTCWACPNCGEGGVCG